MIGKKTIFNEANEQLDHFELKVLITETHFVASGPERHDACARRLM